MIDRHVVSAGAGSLAGEYVISAARPKDIVLLPAIELAAAKLLVGHAPPAVLAETTSPEDHARAQRRGLLWVALADDAPVGFAHVDVIEAGSAHLEELDVHPDHARRRLGTRLVMAVCAWAASEGLESVTLSTFRDVPWNMPFYARLGFEIVSPDQLTPALRAKAEGEIARGLDPAKRVTMRRYSGERRDA